MKYTCEFCGKSYPTPERAGRCEATHISDSDERIMVDEISNAINEYVDTYEEFPDLKLSDDSLDLLERIILRKFDDILPYLVRGTFSGADEAYCASDDICCHCCFEDDED